MTGSAVAASYAGALLELADREDAVELFGERLEEVAALYEQEPSFRLFLETPRVSIREKKEVLARALGDRLPAMLLRFLMVVLEKGRQAELPAIRRAYRGLVDRRENRVHALVRLAWEADPAVRQRITGRLEEMLGCEVVPHFRVDPSLIGGMVVRVEDRVLDGSLRRGLASLKRKLLEAETDG